MAKLRAGISAEEILFGIKSENVDNRLENVDNCLKNVKNVDNFDVNVDKLKNNVDNYVDNLKLPVKVFTVVKFNGESHTIKEWSKILGILPQTLTSRLNRGWSLERAFNESVDKKDICKTLSPRKLITYKGKTLSINAWADRFGMDVKALIGRLERGWSVEDAFTKQLKSEAGKAPGNVGYVLRFKGEEHTLKEWSQITGINISTLRGRVTRGWSTDDILSIGALNIGQCDWQKKLENVVQQKKIPVNIDHWLKLRVKLKNLLDDRKLFGDHIKKFDAGIELAYAVLDGFMLENYKLDNKWNWWERHAEMVECLIDEKRLWKSHGFNIGLKTAWNIINDFMLENFN